MSHNTVHKQYSQSFRRTTSDRPSWLSVLGVQQLQHYCIKKEGIISQRAAAVPNNSPATAPINHPLLCPAAGCSPCSPPQLGDSYSVSCFSLKAFLMFSFSWSYSQNILSLQYEPLFLIRRGRWPSGFTLRILLSIFQFLFFFFVNLWINESWISFFPPCGQNSPPCLYFH